MTTAYDPATTYATDFQYMDFVETVDWVPNIEGASTAGTRTTIEGCKIRPADMTDRRNLELAAGLELSTEDKLYQFWKNSDAECEVRPRDFLRKEGTELGWLVQTAIESPFGYWLLACVKERRNAPFT